MPGLADIKAGQAYVELLLKDEKFNGGLARAGRRLQEFGKNVGLWGAGIAAAGAALTVPILDAVHRFASAGDKLNKMSLRTGTSVQALSELGYAAEKSGLDIDSLEMALRKMQKTIGTAFEGSSDSIIALSRLGIGLDDLRGKSPDEQFERIADALARVRDNALKTKLAIDIFGKGGPELFPLIAHGAAGIEARRREGRESGQTMSPQDAQMASRLASAFKELDAVTENLWKKIGAGAAGPVLEAIEKITTLQASVGKWIGENRGLFASLLKVGTALTVVGTVVTATGLGIAIFGTAFRGIAAGAAAAGAAVTGVGVAAAYPLRALKLVTGAAGLVNGALAKCESVGSKAFAAVASYARGAAAAVGQLGSPLARVASGFGQIGLGAGGIGADAGRAIVRGLTATLKAAGPAVGRGLSAALSAAVSGSASALRSGLAGLGGVARRGLAAVLGDPAIDVIKGGLERLWARIGPGFRKAFLEAYFVAYPVIERISAAVGMISPAAGAISKSFRPIGSFARSAAATVVSAWRRVGPAIAAGITSAVRGAFRTVTAAGLGAARSVGRGFRSIGSGLGNVVGGAAQIAGILGSKGGGGIASALGSFASFAPHLLAVGSAFAGLLNPVGLVVAGIGLAAVAFYKFSDAGRAAMDKIIAFFEPFVATFKKIYQGVVDAINAGDLSLAGQIAVAGLKAVFAQGLAAISDLIGGTFGDAVGQIGAQLLGGDFAGAWDTAVGLMGATWDAFALGIVKTFRGAIEAVIGMWQAATKAIADFLLKDAAEGGFLGTAALLGTGVDVTTEQGKAELIRRQNISTKQREVATEQGNLEQAKKNGGTFTDETGTYSEQEIQNRINELNKQLKELAGSKADVLGDMQRDAGAALDRIARGATNSVDSTGDAIQRQAEENAAKSAAALKNKAEGGASAAAAAAAAAQAELDALVAKAAAARAQVDAEHEARKKDAEGAVGGFDQPSLSKEIFGSFSAAALVAGGGAGDPSEETAKNTRELVKAHQRQLVLDKRIADMLAGRKRFK